MKAIIIGGGIGGLTTALMLHARGIDCEIFEQADAIRELGVGINTLPHAIKELAELGLLPRLDQRRHPHPRTVLHQPLRPGDLARAARHRRRLRIPAVLDPPRPLAGGDLSGGAGAARRARIHTGHRLGSFTQDDAGVTAYFFGRDGAHRATARGDILIGADGIHSFVRETLYPERRTGALERLDAVARRARLAAIPDRPLDGDRRRHGGEAGGLSDRRRRARGPAAHQLGGAGQGRRGRRAAAQGGLVARRAASRT